MVVTTMWVSAITRFEYEMFGSSRDSNSSLPKESCNVEVEMNYNKSLRPA